MHLGSYGGDELLFPCTAKLGAESITPPQSPDAEVSGVSSGCVQSSLPFWTPSEAYKRKQSPPSPHSVRWRATPNRRILKFTGAWQGPDFCAQEVSYRSAVVQRKPQASGRGCLHSLLHPSREPKAFHHKAIERFLP